MLWYSEFLASVRAYRIARMELWKRCFCNPDAVFNCDTFSAAEELLFWEFVDKTRGFYTWVSHEVIPAHQYNPDLWELGDQYMKIVFEDGV